MGKEEIARNEQFLLSHSVFHLLGELYASFNKFEIVVAISITGGNCMCRIDCICSLNPYPNKPWFLRVCNNGLLKTLWEKEKLLVMSNFSFSHSVFYPFGQLSAIFIKFEIVVFKLFQFKRV